MTITFVQHEWDGQAGGRHQYVVHRVDGVALSAENFNNIPDGFELRAACGKTKRESTIDLSNQEETYLQPSIKCPKCFP